MSQSKGVRTNSFALTLLVALSLLAFALVYSVIRCESACAAGLAMPSYGISNQGSSSIEALSSGPSKPMLVVTRANSGQLGMKKGASYKLGATATKGAKLRYKSSKPKIVSVSKKGKLKAKKVGKATVTIKARCGKTTLTKVVKVAVVKATKFKMAKKIAVSIAKPTLVVGQKAKVKAVVTPKKASNKNVVFKSSNTKVASVSASGVVVAKNMGLAKITAISAGDGKVKASALIRVIAPLGVYRKVIANWQKEIELDKKTSEPMSYTWEQYTTSPSYVNSSVTGERFVYALVDLGLDFYPALIVADPDNEYMIYGIYQFTGEKIAYSTAHFRWWWYLCEGGYLRYHVNYPSISDGYGSYYNYDYSILQMDVGGVLSSGNWQYETIERLSYGSFDSYGTYYDRTGASTRVANAWTAKRAIDKRYPVARNVVWKKVVGGFDSNNPEIRDF